MILRPGRALAALAIAIALSPTAAARASAPPAPTNLRVPGGTPTWHADNDLRIAWDTPLAPLAAAHCRVRDEAGVVVASADFPWRPQIGSVHLPAPGVYLAEVWFENATGEQGPRANVELRFDDRRPAAIEPLPPKEWIGADEEPLLRFTQPAAPQPLSGIRGYAFSLGSDPDGRPCLKPDRCTDAETDLREGAAGNSVRLGRLPNGDLYVHAVAVSGAGVSSTVGAGVLHVDATAPEVSVSKAAPTWSNQPVRVTAKATDGRSGMNADGASGPITALSIDGAVPAVAGGDAVSALVSGDGIHAVAAFARDAAGNLGGSGAVVAVDRAPPAVAFATTLDSADPELLEARVLDGLSGPDPSRGSVGIRPRGSHRQFEPLPTTVAGGRLLARWDSDRYPPGVYEFRATAYDAAGNSGGSGLRGNGTAMVLPAPLKAATRLVAGFGGGRLVWHRCARAEAGRRCRREVVESFDSRPAARTIPYGRGVAVGGTLTGPSGEPLAGLPVRVVEDFDASGGVAKRERQVQTAADGSFLTRLAPGPSRRIEFLFPGTRTLAASGARRAELVVRGGVRLRASGREAAVGGRPIVFSGAVADPAAIPEAGKSVDLQFRLPGLPWTQFRTVRTNSRGRFRYPYRFSDDDSRGVRFQFRALAAAEPQWPYAPAASRPLFVWGR